MEVAFIENRSVAAGKMGFITDNQFTECPFIISFI